MPELKIKIEVEITARELTDALEKLAAATLGGRAPALSPVPPAPPVPASAAAPAPTAPPPAAAPAPTAPPPAAVPTAPAPAYTLDQIARAGASLMDAGKREPLLALLARYGVQAVTQLQPGQYGVFATELRALGAQI